MQMRFGLTAQPVLEVAFPGGHICLYGQTRMEEIAYTIFSLLFGKGLTLSPLIGTFDVFGRRGGVCCRRDPTNVASSVVRQDAVYRAHDN